MPNTDHEELRHAACRDRIHSMVPPMGEVVWLSIEAYNVQALNFTAEETLVQADWGSTLAPLDDIAKRATLIRTGSTEDR